MYLDCGCYIDNQQKRHFCPTCTNPFLPQAYPQKFGKDREAIYKAEQAVIEAARKHLGNCSWPTELSESLETLDRARGEGKDEHGH